MTMVCTYSCERRYHIGKVLVIVASDLTSLTELEDARRSLEVLRRCDAVKPMGQRGNKLTERSCTLADEGAAGSDQRRLSRGQGSAKRRAAAFS